MKYSIAQFIPIILIFLFLTMNDRFHQFSQTILGKLVAIGLIIFYVFIDKYVGLFVCALVIFFYQSSTIEGMDTIDVIEIDEVGEMDNEGVDDGTYIFLDELNKIRGSKVDVINKKTLSLVEPTFSGSEDEFRKQNCERGVLKYKNMKVKDEMADIVFPQIKFKGPLCNPCNKTCNISVSS